MKNYTLRLPFNRRLMLILTPDRWLLTLWHRLDGTRDMVRVLLHG